MRYLFFENNPRFSVTAQLAFPTQSAHEPISAHRIPKFTHTLADASPFSKHTHIASSARFFVCYNEHAKKEE